MADEWMYGGYPDTTTSTLPTAAPVSQLDQASGDAWGFVTGSLSKLLDTYTELEVAKYNGQPVPSAGVPVGYMKLPSGQVVPAGAVASSGGGFGMSTVAMLALAGVALFLLMRKG